MHKTPISCEQAKYEFSVRPDTRYEALTENQPLSTSELAVLVHVDGRHGRSAGLLVRVFLLSDGCFCAGRRTQCCLPRSPV